MSTKNIIVTGASGNLGSAVVAYFLEKGHRVVGFVHGKPKDLPTSENFKEVAANLLDEEEVATAMETLHQEYGHFDAAILTAGGFMPGRIENTGTKELNQMVKLNFETAYHLTRQLLTAENSDQETKLFFIGSEPGKDPAKGKSVAAYALSKSMLFSFSEMINGNYKNQKAFVVVPSTIDTPQNRKALPDADFSKWQKPMDIAKIIYKAFIEKDRSAAIIEIEKELKTL